MLLGLLFLWSGFEFFLLWLSLLFLTNFPWTSLFVIRLVVYFNYILRVNNRYFKDRM